MPSFSNATLSWKKLYDLANELGDIKTYRVPMQVEFYKISDPAKKLIVGGIWEPFNSNYAESLDFDKRSRVPLHDAQWQFLEYILEALEQSVSQEKNEIPIQDIVMHGGRRSGKSVALAAAALVWALAKPASKIWIVSKRKRHGERIMHLLKRWLPAESWYYKKLESTLWLRNYSVFRAINEAHYNAERGDSVDLLIMDEAAFMDEDVYFSLAPSVIDRNGVVAMASSPNGFNWFFSRAMQVSDPDPVKSKSVRTCSISTFDNPFLSESARHHARSARNTMSKDAYLQEIMGEFINPSGLVLPDFRPDVHVKNFKIEENFDAMEQLGSFSFDFDNLHVIVGVDFNFDPTAGIITQFDEFGRFLIVKEHIGHQGTEQWARDLESVLLDLGIENPKNETLIIADASGRWQGEGRNAQHRRATWKILRSLGWRVIGPSIGKKNNPRREDRMEVMRALTMSASGEPRLFVHPSATEAVEMFQTLPLKFGLPDPKHRYIHLWDAVGYAAYRVWGTPVGRAVFGHELTGRFLNDLE